MFNHKGPLTYPVLLHIMGNGKTNQNGRIEYSKLLRYKNVFFCGISALAVYLFWHWEQLREFFPLFKDNKSWHNTRVLVSEFNFSIFHVLVSFWAQNLQQNQSPIGWDALLILLFVALSVKNLNRNGRIFSLLLPLYPYYPYYPLFFGGEG